MNLPPSTLMACPVMKPASGEASKNVGPNEILGLLVALQRAPVARAARISRGKLSRTASVTLRPVAMTLTVMP